MLLLLHLIRAYSVQTRVRGERLKQSDKFNISQTSAALFPTGFLEDPTLTVVHGKLDAARCSLMLKPGPNESPEGANANFSIVSKDSFGNTRYVRWAVCERGACGSSLARVNSSQLPVLSTIAQSVS